MKFLVTGAGGYIGRHVVNELLKLEGSEVTAIGRESIDSRARLIDIDIFDEKADLYNIAGKPDVCIHLAWRDGFVHNSDAHMLNLSKHYDFLCRMTENGIKGLTVMGTMHEIGYHEGAVDEHTPCNPLSMYGISKDTLRRSLFLRLNNTILQWIRVFYIYGDDKHNKSIFTKLMQAEEEGKMEFPFTSGKNKYDFIHVNELARQIAAVAAQDRVNGIINCCSGKPVSLAEQVETFIKNNSFNIKLKYGAYPDRPYDSPATWGNNMKIKKILELV